jgi:hypothetical protein
MAYFHVIFVTYNGFFARREILVITLIFLLRRALRRSGGAVEGAKLKRG